MRRSSPVEADQTVYLKDYQKPAFLVESINLDIQVYDDKTIVDSTLVMKRQTAGDLVLLGRDLELQSIPAQWPRSYSCTIFTR